MKYLKTYEKFGEDKFTAWFGNSKVVDRNGQPLKVYHGSPDLRNIKDTGVFMTPHQKYRDSIADEEGVFFFTSDFSCARSYADPRRAFDYQGCEEGVIPVYLKIENPYVYDNQNQSWKGTRKLVDEVKAMNKYDGIIIKNTKDNYNNTDRTKSTTVYIVFYPNQIKSAESNKGTFSPHSHSIYELFISNDKIRDDLEPGFEEWTILANKFYTNILPKIEKNCSKFLDEMKSNFPDKITSIEVLYRGKRDLRGIKDLDLIRLNRRKDRTPMSTYYPTHEALGELSEEYYGWNMRTEGVFTTASSGEAGLYGTPYIFLPIGDYNYLYNEKVRDLTRFLANNNIDYTEGEHSSGKNIMYSKDKEKIKKRMSEIMSMYKGDNLKNAIHERVEVIFNCDEYFLVNKKFMTLFIDYMNKRKAK